MHDRLTILEQGANVDPIFDTIKNWYNNIGKYWLLDADNDALYTNKNVYSTQEISAYGLGSGGGGGTGYDRLDAWADYDSSKSGWVLSALLGNDLNTRVTSLENGSATSIETTGSGNAITSVSKSGNLLTFNKGLEFSLSTHNHDAIYKPIGYVPSWDEITGKPSTFAPSAHTHTIANVTGLQSALDGKQPTISTGTTSQYYRGDKTWQTLNTSVVPEGTNLYFTNARVKAYGDTLYSPLGHTHTIAQITGLQGALDAKAPLANPTFTGNVTAPTFIGALSGNASSATKLQTARTINGVAFDGSANITITAATPATLTRGSYLTGSNFNGSAATTWAVDATSANTASKVVARDASGNFSAGTITAALSGNAATATKLQTARTIAGVSFDGTANIAIPFANLASKPTTLEGYGITDAVTIDTAQTVTGAKTFSAALTASVSVTTPKVIIAAAGWSVEQSGTELLFKYNGTTKQRLLNDGGIAAIGEVTAYTAGDSGYSEFLQLSGGKITGNLEITGNLKFTSSSVIGLSTLPLALAGNAFTYNSYDVLHKGNIGSSQIASIGLENGWTIEQTSTALYIKKSGVIKGTFNA